MMCAIMCSMTTTTHFKLTRKLRNELVREGFAYQRRYGGSVESFEIADHLTVPLDALDLLKIIEQATTALKVLHGDKLVENAS